MADYRYRGRTMDGRLDEGEMMANSVDEVVENLYSRGVTPVDVALAPRKRSINLKRLMEPQGAVKVQDLLLLCRQLHAMLQAGVPIHTALHDVVTSFEHRGLVKVLTEVREQVGSGLSLSNALNEHPSIFSDLFVQMVRAGESTGTLDQIFLSLSQHIEREHIFHDKLVSAVRYPILMVSLSIVAMLVISIWVVPAFSGILSSMGGELPLPTRILMAVSTFLQESIGWLAFYVALAIGLFTFHRSTPKGKLFWDRQLMRMPIFGELVSKGILARFTQSLALISRSGVPLSQGLDLVAGMVGNRYFESRVRDLKRRVDEGVSFSQAAREIGIFTPMVIQIFKVGEQAGEMDELLEHVSGFYERETNKYIENINTLIEPLMLVLIGGIVLILGLGVMLPYLEMLRSAVN